MTHDEGQALRALVRTLEANQVALLRRVEELEHRAGVAVYTHASSRPPRALGDGAALERASLPVLERVVRWPSGKAAEAPKGRGTMPELVTTCPRPIRTRGDYLPDSATPQQKDDLWK